MQVHACFYGTVNILFILAILFVWGHALASYFLYSYMNTYNKHIGRKHVLSQKQRDAT